MTGVTEPDKPRDPVKENVTDSRTAGTDDLSAGGSADASEEVGTCIPGLKKNVVTSEGLKVPLKDSTKKHNTLIVVHENPIDLKVVAVHSEIVKPLTAPKVDGSVSGKGASTRKDSEEVKVGAKETTSDKKPGIVGNETATEEPTIGCEALASLPADGKITKITISV